MINPKGYTAVATAVDRCGFLTQHYTIGTIISRIVMSSLLISRMVGALRTFSSPMSGVFVVLLLVVTGALRPGPAAVAGCSGTPIASRFDSQDCSETPTRSTSFRSA